MKNLSLQWLFDKKFGLPNTLLFVIGQEESKYFGKISLLAHDKKNKNSLVQFHIFLIAIYRSQRTNRNVILLYITIYITIHTHTILFFFFSIIYLSCMVDATAIHYLNSS